MTILDTNVVSEALRNPPDPAFIRWIDDQDRESLYLTTITVAELLFGVEQLPSGRRRQTLEASINLLIERFDPRILPFDKPAAAAFASISARRRALGRPIASADAMIAAIALTQQAAVATRDTAGFEHCGLRIVNPWKS